MRVLLTTLLLTVLASCSTTTNTTKICDSCWVETKLFFGLEMPGGKKISEKRWEKFIDQHITPLFPDGLTQITTSGQWKNSKTGNISKEKSKVVIILYPHSQKKENDLKLKKISTKYIEIFKQQAILRSDNESKVIFYTE